MILSNAFTDSRAKLLNSGGEIGGRICHFTTNSAV